MKKILMLSLIAALSSCTEEAQVENIELNAPAVKVTTLALSNASTTATNFMLNGKVVAQKNAQISTRVMGTIAEVLVKEGQLVQQGQTLAVISSSDLNAQKARVQAQIAAAEAGLKNAKRNYDRFKSLYESKSVTEQEFNQAEMGYTIAQSNVTAAKEGLKEVEVQLGYARIQAPFQGRITQKMANQGSMANPGMPLFAIESTGQALIAVDLPASQIKQVSLNDAVSISIPDMGQSLQGKVTLMNPSASYNGQQYHVEITPEGNPSLLTGMNAKITFQHRGAEAKTETASVWIPKSALVDKGQLHGVYTISEQQTALLRWVRLGEAKADQVEVVSGLSAEESIITKAEGRLYNGAKINQ